MDIFGGSLNKKNKFEPGNYVMTQPISEQDIRVLTADIVAHAIFNKVPDELSNKIKVEKYLRDILRRLPESVLTYIWEDPGSKQYRTSYPGYSYNPYGKQHSLPQFFVYLEDPKNPKGNPIEYPIKCIEEFFSF